MSRAETEGEVGPPAITQGGVVPMDEGRCAIFKRFRLLDLLLHSSRRPARHPASVPGPVHFSRNAVLGAR